MMDDFVEKDNIVPQPNSYNFYQQIISPTQINFANVDHDVDVPTVEVGKRKVSEENVAKVRTYLILTLVSHALLFVSIPKIF